MAKCGNKDTGKYFKILFKDNTIFCEILNTVRGPLSVASRNKVVSLLKINVQARNLNTFLRHFNLKQ